MTASLQKKNHQGHLPMEGIIEKRDPLVQRDKPAWSRAKLSTNRGKEVV
jgi:hypothetical protein